MLSNKSGRLIPPGGSRGLVLGMMGILAVVWVGMLVRGRSQLGLENHVAQTIPLVGAPAGPAAQAGDGRLFVVTAEQQLVALERGGEFAWNKRLPGPVTPVPIVATAELLVLVGRGVLYGYSLGGEERFRVEVDTALGDLAAADGKGHLGLLDAGGSLTILTEKGQRQSRTSLGLRHNRRLIVLPGGQLMGVGTRDDGTHHMFWAEPSGLIGIRSLLPAAPVGVAVSARSGESVGVTAGRELWTLAAEGPPEQLIRRLPLPGLALSAPLLLAAGDAYVLVQQDGGEALCHLEPATAASRCVPTADSAPEDPLPQGLPRQPTLGRNGLVFAPFTARRRLLPSYHGVVALRAGRIAYRQALPGDAATHLMVDLGGALLAGTGGENYLFRLDSGGSGTGAYSVWPQALGSPEAAGRSWP